MLNQYLWHSLLSVALSIKPIGSEDVNLKKKHLANSLILEMLSNVLNSWTAHF